MEILRKLRFVLYPIVFVLVFICASYCTFPKDVLGDMAESFITNAALRMGPRTAGLPEVSIKDISLWRISGVSIEDSKILWPSKKTEMPLALKLDSLRGRVGIFSFLVGSRSFSGDVRLYDGEVDASLNMHKKNVLRSINITAKKVNLGKMAFLDSFLGAPLKGIVNLAVNLRASSELSKDGAGTIKLNFDNLACGPGSIKLPTGGFVSSLTIPETNLGKFVADFSFDKGQLESKTFTLSGGDLEAELKITANIGNTPFNSRIDGEGWFSVKKEFVGSNETLKMLYDLIPELKAAEASDGKVGLLIRGSFARPDIKLERYTGAK